MYHLSLYNIKKDMLLTGPFAMLSMPLFDFHLPPCTEGFLIHPSPLWQLPLFPSVAQFPCVLEARPCKLRLEYKQAQEIPLYFCFKVSQGIIRPTNRTTIFTSFLKIMACWSTTAVSYIYSTNTFHWNSEKKKTNKQTHKITKKKTYIYILKDDDFLNFFCDCHIIWS